MKEKNESLKKRLSEILFTTEHTLTPEQFKKRVQDKINRAKQYRKAYKKQIVSVEKYD